MEVSGRLHASATLLLGERTLDKHWIGPINGLGTEEKKNTYPYRESNPDCQPYRYAV